LSVEQLLNIVLGGGLLSALGTWWWNRHKPRVDRQVTTVEGLAALVEKLQKQLEDERKETEAERSARQACEVGKREVEARNDQLLRSEGALAHELDSVYSYLISTMHGVAAGMIPPWQTPPYVLHDRLKPESFPVVISRHHDTGVPGVDLTPPPDDGQDTDPTQE